MPLVILSPEIPGETDAEIIGNLAKHIMHPEPDDLPLVHTPKPFIAPAVMDTCKPVELRLDVPYFMYCQPKPEPEPLTHWQRFRAWWAANIRDIKALGGGIGFMVLLYILLVAVSVL